MFEAYIASNEVQQRISGIQKIFLPILNLDLF